ncbi:MAG: hypothetical protein AAGL69_15040 [Pseudomonadota bacterium]
MVGNDNPYNTPEADLSSPTREDAIAVYSPNQVSIGTFLAGPLAAVYFLHSNYMALQKQELAARTIPLGVLFTIVLIALLPFVPEGFPNIVIPLAYGLAVKAIVDRTQFTTDDIEANPNYRRISTWKVAGICVVALILFFIVMIPVLLILDGLGVVKILD